MLWEITFISRLTSSVRMACNSPARVRDLLTGYIYANPGPLLETVGSPIKVQTSKTGYSYQDNTCFVELFILKDWFSCTSRIPYFWKKTNIFSPNCFYNTNCKQQQQGTIACYFFYLFRTVASASCSKCPGTVSTYTTRYGFTVIMALHPIPRTTKASRSHVSRYCSWYTQK